MKKTEIITLCCAGFFGTNRALSELERNTGLTRHFVVDGLDKDSLDVKFYLELIKEDKPRLLIFGGWNDLYRVFMNALSGRGISFGVYWTSSPGQTGITPEMDKLAFILRASGIQYKLFSSAEFAGLLAREGWETRYLPMTLDVERYAAHDTSGNKGPLTLSMFCSPFDYGRKNVLNCLLALSSVRKKYVLHLNGLSKNKYYKAIMKSLNINYVEHGWMHANKYELILDKIDVGIQVTFAETFNYVAAEHMAKGIPVIASRMVRVMDDMPSGVFKRTVVDNVDNAFEIMEKVDRLMSSPEERRALGKKMCSALKKGNRERIRIAGETLKGIR